MTIKRVIRGFWLSMMLGFLAVAGGLSAQVILVNPGIPDNEKIIYQSSAAGVVGQTSYATALVSEGGRTYYEVHTKASDSEVISRLDSRNLSGFWSDQTEKSATSTIRRTTEIISNTAVSKADELQLSDLNSLLTALRGFPWDKTKYAKLVFVGAANYMGGMNLELNVLGKETVKIPAGTWECYKMQMGLNGILGGLVPKSNFWYAVKSPHVLIRYEGATGPGSPVRVLELRSYESSN